MSETVFYTGKVKKLGLSDLSWAEKKMVLKSRGFDVDKCDDEDDLYDVENLAVINEDIYEVIEKNGVDDVDDIFIAKKDESGVICFSVKYYNGGCGFEDALETAIERMEERS